MTQRSSSSPLLRKFLRLGAFLFCAQALGVALIARGVRAEVQDLMLSFGSQMMHVGELAEAASPRTIRLNGAQVRIRTERIRDMSLDRVLDHFESRCRARNGRFYEQLQQGAKHKLLEEQLDSYDGVLRAESDEAGAVACFDVGDEKGTPDSLLERARRFVQTGDASSFGELRYVRAEQTEKGVFAVMLWTDGPMNIRRMFPAVGDAPGVEFPDLPRPPNSRRILSAWQEGQAPALNMYESTSMSDGELDNHYRKVLGELGWEATHAPVKKKGAHGLLVIREGVTVAVSNSPLEGGRRALTSIMPMDTRGATRVPVP